MDHNPPYVTWKPVLVIASAVALLALLPQVFFWAIRASEYKGAYVVLQGDEFLYSAYVNALVDQRSRRNDPFLGQDDQPTSHLPESLFSIQWVPPFTIAWLCRLIGISASSGFVLLLGVAGLLASWSIYALLLAVLHDRLISASGVAITLCLGTAVANQGFVGLLFNHEVAFVGLLFLRRYVPAAPFPCFFLFGFLIIRALAVNNRSGRILRSLLAGITLSILVFSYFYLWTAAMAWFVSVIALWIIFRRSELRSTLDVLFFVSIPVVCAFIPYLYLLSHLRKEVENPHALGFTHAPDLFRSTEILGLASLTVLVSAIRKKFIDLKNPQVLIAMSFSVLPLLVFNQQILTGRSLQPFHYQVFVVNYVVLMAWIITVYSLRPRIARRSLILITVLSLMWGAFEVSLPYEARRTSDVENDLAVPVCLRLKELSDKDGSRSGLRSVGMSQAIVFSPETSISKQLPTWSTQGLLLNVGSISFQLLPRDARINSLFLHLYYCGKTPTEIRELLQFGPNQGFLAYYAKSTLFGPERVLPMIGEKYNPIRSDEIESAVELYSRFREDFSVAEVQMRPLTYAIIKTTDDFDFSIIDRWYERDSPEQVGSYNLYRLKPRS